MIERSVLLVAGLSLAVALPVAACSAEQPNSSILGEKVNSQDVPIGKELTLCADCPAFVRVPDAPKSMRSVRYVMKYELTWKNFLSAYDAGRCSSPNPSSGMGLPPENILPNHINKLRVDWPASRLSTKDIQCYIGWLQDKTSYTVSLPNEIEWEWFARAGSSNTKYPWGNERDITKEPLYGDEVPLNKPDYYRNIRYEHGRKYISGAMIGQFAPNNWGLYDILGNDCELTSIVRSGEDHFRQYPNEFNKLTRSKNSALVKGCARYLRESAGIGIPDKRYAVIWDNQYSIPVAIRLVLTE